MGGDSGTSHLLAYRTAATARVPSL